MLDIRSSYSSPSETAASLISDYVLYCFVFLEDEMGVVVESSICLLDSNEEFVWHSQGLVDGGAEIWSQ